MQNRYAGDIGDFSKFILLKKLFGNKKIGLNWYLYPDENHNNDGVYINYNYENDYGISKILNKVSCEKRAISSLEKSLKENNIFNDITYFSKCIEPKSENLSRSEYRQNWFSEFLKQFEKENREIIFVDPDNGLEIKSIPTIGRKKAGKYIFYDEIEQILELNNISTLIIYQHFRREKDFKNKILKEIKEKLLSKNISKKYNFYIISFHKLSPRAYIIITKENLHKELDDFVKKTSDWKY